VGQPWPQDGSGDGLAKLGRPTQNTQQQQDSLDILRSSNLALDSGHDRFPSKRITGTSELLQDRSVGRKNLDIGQSMSKNLGEQSPATPAFTASLSLGRLSSPNEVRKPSKSSVVRLAPSHSMPDLFEVTSQSRTRAAGAGRNDALPKRPTWQLGKIEADIGRGGRMCPKSSPVMPCPPCESDIERPVRKESKSSSTSALPACGTAFRYDSEGQCEGMFPRMSSGMSSRASSLLAAPLPPFGRDHGECASTSPAAFLESMEPVRFGSITSKADIACSFRHTQMRRTPALDGLNSDHAGSFRRSAAFQPPVPLDLVRPASRASQAPLPPCSQASFDASSTFERQTSEGSRGSDENHLQRPFSTCAIGEFMPKKQETSVAIKRQRLPLDPLPPMTNFGVSPTSDASLGSGITVSPLGLDELLGPGLDKAACAITPLEHGRGEAGVASFNDSTAKQLDCKNSLPIDGTPNTTAASSGFGCSDIDSMCNQVLEEDVGDERDTWKRSVFLDNLPQSGESCDQQADASAERDSPQSVSIRILQSDSPQSLQSSSNQQERRQECTRMLLGNLKKGVEVEDPTNLPRQDNCWRSAADETAQRREWVQAKRDVEDIDDRASTMSASPQNSCFDFIEYEDIRYDESDSASDASEEKCEANLEWDLVAHYVGNAMSMEVDPLEVSCDE